MYTQFFGLREKPFSITPDPHFLYLSERHAEALAHLVYGVTDSGGFIQLTGEVGTGKTTLTRSLLERLPAEVDIALVLNPRLSVTEFMLTIFDELKLPAPTGSDSIKALVDALNVRLLDAHAEGRRTVLLVDEAQNLTTEVLEQLRLLTNLETAKEKLLQIILVGQPELRRTLARNDMRQLAQRITGRYHLDTLSRGESEDYVRHRLRIAGADREDVFGADALDEIYRVSSGVPRLINVVCDRALLGAFVAEQYSVDRSTVRKAAREVGCDAPAPQKAGRTWWLAAAALLAPMAVAAAWVIGTRVTAPPPSASAGDLYAAATAEATKESSSSPPQWRSLHLAMTPQLRGDDADDVIRRVDLATWFADPAIETGTDAAFKALFALWQIDGYDSRGPACEFALRYELKCEFQQGSWSLLKALNRPAILSLIDGDGRTHHVVAGGLTDARVVVFFGARRVELPRDIIDRYWYGEYLVLWRPQTHAGELMLPGQSGPGIAWLTRSLEQLDGTPASGGDVYDEALERRVSRFQRAHRLEADGKAGVQTQIAINTALDLPGTPTLTGGG